MYEMKVGTARLKSALWRRSEDQNFISTLAKLLDYTPEQLKEDIRALQDYYDATQETGETDN